MKTSASQLKAKLGQFMRAVRAGHEIVITDRDQPVARLSPYRAERVSRRLEVSQPRDPTAPPLGEVKVRSVRVVGVDSLALLRADRERR